MTQMTPQLQSTLTCPECGYAKQEIMPTASCQFFYECEHCKTVLRPNPGDCCVFCSYGSVKCPPVQLQRGCCGHGGTTGAGSDEPDGQCTAAGP